MNNEIKINVPEGMEIDKENSTFECIKFKPKWIPKRGDIATTGHENSKQIMVVGEYIKQYGNLGFDIKCLALLDMPNCILAVCNFPNTMWILEEASASEKEQLISELNKEGYVYNPNDSRIIYKKEKELPKTWKEFCENNPRREGEYFIDDFSKITDACPSQEGRDIIEDANVLPSKGYAKAMLALCKLIQLRDCYNKGWKPDWSKEVTKYAITYKANKAEFVNTQRYSFILSFKTEDLRDTFYHNFKDLIEQAQLLL